MDAQERLAFVDRPLTAVFSTVDTKGRPHAVPVWYAWRDGAFEVYTDRGSQKHRNVEATGRAALCIDERDGAYRHVTAEGPCEVQDPITKEERLSLHLLYRSEEAARTIVDRGGHEKMVILRLRPERWY
jgi:PPOX class probable F420-dependent enzyme